MGVGGRGVVEDGGCDMDGEWGRGRGWGEEGAIPMSATSKMDNLPLDYQRSQRQIPTYTH